MKTLRLTDRWLRAISVKTGREEFADSITSGLRLRVSRRTKNWSVVTRRDNKQIRLPLGSYPDVGLSDARDRANAILSDPSGSSIDAVIGGSKNAETPSLESLFNDYIEQMKAKGQKSHKEYSRVLINSPHSFYNFMHGKMKRGPRVGDVHPSHVAEWLREIYQRAPSHARHCRAYLHAVFAWATRAEFDYTSTTAGTDYGVKLNPVASTPGGPKSKARQRVLSISELKNFWKLIPEVADPTASAALRLLITMGGLRISEILHSEVSWYEKEWLTIPETKNGREHGVPLTELAKKEFAIARKVAKPGSKFLFSHRFDNDKPMPVTTVGRVTKRIIERNNLEHFQLRDLRRTMKTHLLDGEYVEEREIDVWHNHGQNSDIARKHYSWAEYKQLKLRVAGQIDKFLSHVMS